MAVADHGVVFNGRGQKFLSAKLESDSLGLVLEAPLPSKRGGNFFAGNGEINAQSTVVQQTFSHRNPPLNSSLRKACPQRLRAD
jgi:hypothetical protein